MLEDAIVTPSLERRYSSVVAISYELIDLPGWTVRVKTTALIDLTDSPDAIFSKFNDTTRNEIRRTLKNDDFQSVHGDEWFERSYRLYSEFEHSQSRLPVSKDELHSLEFFGVAYKGELVSGMYVMASGNFLRIRSIVSKRLATGSKEMYKVVSNASRRVIWDICKWGTAGGYESLDLGSVNFENPVTANITNFKMSFKGPVIDEYTYLWKSKPFVLAEKALAFRTGLLSRVKS